MSGLTRGLCRAGLCVLGAVLGPSGPVAERVVLRLHARAPLTAAMSRVEPASALRALTLYGSGTLVLERRPGAALQVEVPEHCPVSIPARLGTRPVDVPLRLRFPEDPPPLGFEAEASFTVQANCGERSTIEWYQVEGPALPRLAVRDDGYRVDVRMPPAAAALHAPLGWGIIPISAHAQGRVVLEARAAGAVLHRLQLVATSRASGLPSVAVSQRLLLDGPGWHVLRPAPGGHAQVVAQPEPAQFTPDAPGRWLLADGQGARLAIQAFFHDKAPLDCGRAECHAAIAEAAEHTPMSHALERSLARTPLAALSCMLDCHVSGERGLHDGGFLDVQRQLAWTGSLPASWAELPQPLRRLGAVRCTSCHGPGAIPEPRERALLLRSDVCATCHDAPPAYPQVQALGHTRMARSDADPRTRRAPCAGCHTTQGFLERVVGRKPQPHAAVDAAAGISCAACHAPHAPSPADRLVRHVPGTQAPAIDALCNGCHAPAVDEALPSATSAALWRGELQLPAAIADDPQTLRGPAPHREVPGGCVGCHGRDAQGRQAHDFAVPRERCTGCHPGGPPRLNEAIATRARALVEQLERACGSVLHEQPLHAGSTPSCSSPGLQRALYLARAVLEDPAAGWHNAAFAAQLLDAARGYAQRSTSLAR